MLKILILSMIFFPYHSVWLKRKPGKEKKKQFESQVIFWENFAEQLYRVDFFPFYFSGPLKLEFKVHDLKKKKGCVWIG